jgi:hypothetical protein
MKPGDVRRTIALGDSVSTVAHAGNPTTYTAAPKQ